MMRAWVAFTFVTCAAAQIPAPVSVLSGKFTSSLQAADPAGNIYVLGSTNTAGLPVSTDAVQLSYAGGTCIAISIGPPGPGNFPCYDLYVLKLDPTGGTILAATYLGGQGNEAPGGIAVDSQGAVYVSGSSSALTFLPLAGPPVIGQSDFVAKLSTDLNQVNYADAVPASRIVLDSTGNLWTVGVTYGNPRAPTLVKIAPSGTVALQEPIRDMNAIYALALDSAGNPVAVGRKDQGVVVRFQAAGQPVSTSFFANPSFPAAAAVAPDGAVYIAGTTSGSGAPNAPPGGFLTRVNEDGTSQTLAIGRNLSGLAVAPDGRAFALGTASAWVPTTPDALLRCRAGAGINLFVAGWDGVASAPFYATYLGPWNTAPAVGADASGVIRVTYPALERAGNTVSRLSPGVDSGQPPCVDPLPANLASSFYFAATDPFSVPHAVAAGEYVVFYGSGIGPGTAARWDPSADVPLELAGVQLLVGGYPAPLLSVSANQIVVILPLALASGGTADVEVDRDGAPVAVTQVPLAAAAPVVFGTSATAFVAGAVFNEDFSVNSTANPAVPGEVIAVFVSGGGALTPPPADGAIVSADSLPLAQAPTTAFIDGSGYQAVTFAGQAANAAAGLMQMNVRIGYDFAFHGQQTLEVTFAGQRASARFWVQ